jgi:hypothetical protein
VIGGNVDFLALVFFGIFLFIAYDFTKYRLVKKTIGDQEIHYYFEKKKEL